MFKGDKMTAFRGFQRVRNQKIEVQLPQEFEDQEVEIIIFPRDNIPDDLSHLTEAIQQGINSGISPLSHEEIFKNLIAKYAD
jgi:hypothetical protein